MLELSHRQVFGPDFDPSNVDGYLKSRAFPLVDGPRVTFVFRGDADSVALRQWVYGLPSAIPMTRLSGTDLWYQILEFPHGSRIEYKYGVTRHGHEEWIQDPLNPNIAVDPFGGNSVVHGAGYEIPDWAQRQEGVARGAMESFTIASRSFGDTRQIQVYKPANFRTYRRYRLLVVHDGNDYIVYSGLRAVLDNLIARNEIPPMVVALSNPHDRLREYANDARHAEHIVEEVIPAMESRYSLINEPSGRCLMGASFGAVASLSTAWRYPRTFDSLMLQSGSFAFTDIGEHTRSEAFDPVVDFMNQFRQAPGPFASRISMSCGVFESLIYENRSMVPFLQEHNVDVHYVEARDGHNWENWRDRLRDGLSWLFPGPLWVTYM